MKNKCEVQCNLNFMCEHVKKVSYPNKIKLPDYYCLLGVGALTFTDQGELFCTPEKGDTCPDEKNKPVKLVGIGILPEDKKRIDRIADKEGKFRYEVVNEVVNEALNDRKERGDEGD